MINNRQHIDELFSEGYKDTEVVSAFEEIVEIQNGGRKPLMTGIEHMDYFLFDGLTNKMVFIGSRPSMGKCLGKGTKIVMYDGSLKAVEDIEKDDLLMGVDSTPRRVTSLARGVEQMYWVRQKKGIDYRVNESHILSLRKSRNEGKHPKGHIENVDIKTYNNWTSKKKSDYKGYKVGWELPIGCLDLPPYFLGIWLGDGDKDNPTITTVDSEVISFIEEYAKILELDVSIYNDNRNNVKRVRIIDKFRKNNEVLNKLRKLNLIPNKHIPSQFLQSSRKQRLELLAGLIDSDGYLSGKTYEITQSRIALATGIKKLGDSLGFRTTLKTKSIKGVIYYKILISGKIWEIPCRIKRKQIQQFVTKNDTLNTGIIVEKDIVDEYFGFTLDGDRLFLLEDGTVTHNTHNCARIIKNLLDEDMNQPDLKILRLNWEMQTKSLLLRSIKQALQKSMRQILSKPFSEEDKDSVTEAVNQIRHKRVRNFSKIVEGDEFAYLLDKFCQSGDPDEEKIVLIDHLHILNTKERIDNFLSICNTYKLKYKKLSFIIYFQLNRKLEDLWKGKDSNPKNYRPNSIHIYNTDGLYQYADIITTMVIPQVVNLDTYAVVNRNYCENLAEHFIDEGDSNWVKLEGRNRVYFDYIKIRMVDDFEDPKLYCEILNHQREEKLHEEAELEQEDVPAFMKSNKAAVEEEPDLPFGSALEEEDHDDIPF